MPCPMRWPCLLLVALYALACGDGESAIDARDLLSSGKRPNIVLILVDTLRADATTPYAAELNTTPELERWAHRGVLFERVLAQSSWTKISVASIMTSLWPRSHGIVEPTDGLAPEAITLAEWLQDEGYATYAVQTNGWLHQSFGFHQGFNRYLFPRGAGARDLPRASVWPHADRVYQEAVRVIEAHDRARPFFLYLHFMDVHEYAAPLDFKKFGSDSRGAYLAAVRWVDDALQRIRQELDRAGLLGETILVFGSDHGETFGEHGVHGHARNVLTPVLEVPLVFRFPSPVGPIRIKSQVRNLDIVPTLLDLIGAAIPPSFEGRSLLPLIVGEEQGLDRVSYAGLGVPLFRDALRQVSLTDGAWTYARSLEENSDHNELLFDRSVDPGENVNLMSYEPASGARMRDLLNRHLEASAHDVRTTNVRIEPSIAIRLRALGYLE